MRSSSKMIAMVLGLSWFVLGETNAFAAPQIDRRASAHVA